MYRDESMNALVDKAHKQGMPHTDIVNRGYSGLVCALAIDGRIQSFVTFSK